MTCWTPRSKTRSSGIFGRGGLQQCALPLHAPLGLELAAVRQTAVDRRRRFDLQRGHWGCRQHPSAQQTSRKFVTETLS